MTRDPGPPAGDEVSTPTTVTFDELLRPGGRRDLRRLPSLAREAVVLTWRAARREFVLAGALQVIAALSLAGQLLVMRRLLERAQAADGIPGAAAVAPELITFAVLLAIVTVTGLAQREQQRVLAQLVEKHTTARILDVSTTVDVVEYERPAFYDRLQRARVNASIRPLEIATGLIGLVGSGAAVAAVGTALVLAEPLVAALLLIGVLPTIYINRKLSRNLHAFMVRQTPPDRRRGYLYDILSRREEAHEVRAFDSSIHLRAQHDRIYDDKIADLRRTVRQRLRYGLVSGIITALVTAGTLALLLLFVERGRIDLGDAAVAVGAVIILAGKLRTLVSSTNTLYEGSLFLRDFTDFLETAPSRRPSPRRTVTTPEAFDCIEFDGVSFTYPSRTEPSLVDASFSLRRGEVVALVGENGSGKTTLTKLLAGLYRPTAGSIRWDGVDTTEFELSELRQHVAVIFQDYVRYFLAAADNVAISSFDRYHDQDAVEQAARQAGAHMFLERLPSGYDTLLGPAFLGGSDLSTGQWQRLALARAYFRGSPMLILDEPTASLDPRGEYEVFQQVRRLAEGHTIVLVSHRFSSVLAADRILVLEQGRIVQEGSHQALIAADGLYAELFNLQVEGYQARAES